MRSITVFVCSILAFAGASCRADEAISPQARYKAAVQLMSDLPAPAYIRYHATVPKGDSTLTLVTLPDGQAKADFEIGDPPYARTTWSVAYSGQDGAAAIGMDGGYAVSTLALFDPTWHGAYRWLRDGLLASTRIAHPTTLAGHAPAASDAESVIAVVAAFNGGPYDIEDAGPDRCGRRPARRLTLTPLREADTHPLRRVVIDDTDGRICSMRFALSGIDGPAEYRGYVDLHFSEVGSYYLITDGFIDIRIDENGSAMDWARFPLVYSDVVFPDSIPDAFFAPAKN